jgi:hypothetical protein
MKNSRFIGFFFISTLTISLFWYGSMFWKNDFNLRYMYSDEEGYYMYLPAVFIYGSFENIPVRCTFEYKAYPGTNKILTRFTYGVALLEAPFWLLAHLSRYVRGLPLNDPFAVEYSKAILWAASFYTSLGLYFLFFFLQRFFKNPFVVSLTVFIIFLGTNLPFSTIRQAGISHHYTFCLVSMLFYYLPMLYEKRTPSVKTVILIGFLSSLIVLIRPTNILIILIALLFDVQSLSQLKERGKWFLSNSKIIAVGLAAAVAVWIPQITYWHYLSGDWIFYSYTDAKFLYFSSPYLWQIFFWPCNGFLIYSPVMVLALIGLGVTAWHNKLQGRWIIFSFAILSYLCASWSCWWFGGTYGYRSFIDFYPLLALGLAFVLENIFLRSHFTFKIATSIFLIICITLNIRLITYYYIQLSPYGGDVDKLIDSIKCSLWLVQC